jgi:hypothetical protein
MRATAQMWRTCQQICTARTAAHFHGLEIPLLLFPGVSLAKPRSTPGFMLAPAPQAKTKRLLRRLKADFSLHPQFVKQAQTNFT